MAPAANLKSSEMFLITERVFGDGCRRGDLQHRPPPVPQSSPPLSSPAAILPPACTLPLPSGCVQTAASMPPHCAVAVRSVQLARCWGLAAERKHDGRLNFSTTTLIKFSAEMLAVIELLFEIPVRT